MVPNVYSHIVMTLNLVTKHRTAFPRQNLVAHISGSLPLPSTGRYDVTSEKKLKMIAVSKLRGVGKATVVRRM